METLLCGERGHLVETLIGNVMDEDTITNKDTVDSTDDDSAL